MVDLSKLEMEMRSKQYKLGELVRETKTVGLDRQKILVKEYWWCQNHSLRKFSFLFHPSLDEMFNAEKEMRKQWEDEHIETGTVQNFDYHRDIFFMLGGSVLDTFAREVSCFYSSFYGNEENIFNKDCNFSLFVRWLNEGKRPFNKELPKYLDEQIGNKNNPKWICEFLDYRNFIIHVGDVQMRDMQPAGDRVRFKLLPDDPKVIPSKFSYQKLKETIPFCFDFLHNLILMKDYTYDYLIRHIQ